MLDRSLHLLLVRCYRYSGLHIFYSHFWGVKSARDVWKNTCESELYEDNSLGRHKGEEMHFI